MPNVGDSITSGLNLRIFYLSAYFMCLFDILCYCCRVGENHGKFVLFDTDMEDFKENMSERYLPPIMQLCQLSSLVLYFYSLCRQFNKTIPIFTKAVTRLVSP